MRKYAYSRRLFRCRLLIGGFLLGIVAIATATAAPAEEEAIDAVKLMAKAEALFAACDKDLPQSRELRELIETHYPESEAREILGHADDVDGIQPRGECDSNVAKARRLQGRTRLEERISALRAALESKAEDGRKSGPSLADAEESPLAFLLDRENGDGVKYRQVLARMPEDARQDLIGEVTQEYDRCVKKNSFSSYYSCDCIAAEYVGERIATGPEIHSQNITRKVATRCPNREGTAEFTDQHCQTDFVTQLKASDLEGFCSCYADYVAREFAENPSQNSQYIPLLRRRAMDECGYRELVQ